MKTLVKTFVENRSVQFVSAVVATGVGVTILIVSLWPWLQYAFRG